MTDEKMLEPFAKELERQERVRNYRDGDCYLVDCRLTIGDLRRVVAALAASNQEAWVAALLNAPNPDAGEVKRAWNSGGNLTWQTVPLPATPEMLAAAERTDVEMRAQGFANAEPEAIYYAMLDAAPAVGGEPVAWRWKYSEAPAMPWVCQNVHPGTAMIGLLIEPLYASQPASPLRLTGASNLVEEAACLIWSELCPGMVMGDDDLPHYEAAAKAVLALSPASPLRGITEAMIEAAARVHNPFAFDADTSMPLHRAQSRDESRNEVRKILAAALYAPPEQPAADPVEQPAFDYFECKECGFDSVQRASFKGSDECPLCAGDSGHSNIMSRRTARETDKPEGVDARKQPLDGETGV